MKSNLIAIMAKTYGFSLSSAVFYVRIYLCCELINWIWSKLINVSSCKREKEITKKKLPLAFERNTIAFDVNFFLLETLTKHNLNDSKILHWLNELTLRLAEATKWKRTTTTTKLSESIQFRMIFLFEYIYMIHGISIIYIHFEDNKIWNNNVDKTKTKKKEFFVILKRETHRYTILSTSVPEFFSKVFFFLIQTCFFLHS